MNLTAIAIWAFFTLAIVSSRFGGVPLRLVAAASALFAATVVAHAIRRDRRLRIPPAVVALLILQVGLILVAAYRQDPRLTVYALEEQLLLTMPGWLLCAFVRPDPHRALPDWVQRLLNPWTLVAICAVGISLIVAFRIALDAPLRIELEETLIMMRARDLADGVSRYAVSPGIASAFQIPGVEYMPGTIVARSAPGWPLALSGAYRLGLEHWLSTVLTIVTIGLTAWLGFRLHGRAAGLLAAAAMAVNPLTVRFGPTYLGHALTLLLVLLGTHGLLAAEKEARHGYAFAAGAAFAAAILVRPLSAFTLLLAVGLWILLRSDHPAAPLRRIGPGAMVGMAAVVLTFSIWEPGILTQALRTDHFFRWVAYLPGIGPEPEITLATGELLKVTWFSFGAVGAFALGALLVLTDIRPDWRIVLAFGIVPLGLVLLRRPLVGEYTELAPFLALAFAWSVIELRRRHARLAVATAGLILVSSLGASALLLARINRVNALAADLHTAIGAAQSGDPMLVLLAPNAPLDVMGRLWAYNIDGMRGDVVVGRRTTPQADLQLLAQFPDRRFFELVRVGGHWRLEPLLTGVEHADAPETGTVQTQSGIS